MRHLFCSTLAILILSASAAGQVEKGDREIQISGTLVSIEDVSVLMLNGIYGYYYTEKLELGGGPTITRTSFFGYDDTNVSLTLFGRYNLTARDKMVPYLSGQYYQYDLSPDEPLGFFDFSFIQVGGGIKYFVNEYIAYDVSGNLGFSLGGGDTVFLLVAGISAFI